ncbi:MAG: glycosyltransferase family 4 protein [Ornithinibacter sp.]
MRIAFLNWRDSTHPEGGGAEKYAETVCGGLATAGHDVTLFCAQHPGSASEEHRDGVRLLRQGSRLGVYAACVRRLRSLERQEGRFDVVIDTQNGIPFWAAVWTRTPVIVLVHHVHREQWPIVFGPVVSRIGWFIESVVAPRVFRGQQYVAVSQRTKDELADLGVARSAISVIHNGTESPLAGAAGRHPEPRIVVLGRVVPHKRVEHAIAVVARLAGRYPNLRLRVVGDGWWSGEVRAEAERLGVMSRVDLLGHVDEETKHLELAQAWLALAPSIKEGWGLCVVEAASHGTPTVAYSGAGGLSESIVDGSTGVLAADLDQMVAVVESLLEDAPRRQELGDAARIHSGRFTWSRAVESWEKILTDRAALLPLEAGTDDISDSSAGAPRRS